MYSSLFHLLFLYSCPSFFLSLPSPATADRLKRFFPFLFQKKKLISGRSVQKYIREDADLSYYYFLPLVLRRTHKPARSGVAASCRNKTRKLASESGTFYSSVLPCSLCRRGEIIGRREQLQKERKELAAHDHTGYPITHQPEHWRSDWRPHMGIQEGEIVVTPVCGGHKSASVAKSEGPCVERRRSIIR